jgi:hypothetical protein
MNTLGVPRERALVRMRDCPLIVAAFHFQRAAVPHSEPRKVIDYFDINAKTVEWMVNRAHWKIQNMEAEMRRQRVWEAQYSNKPSQ